MARRRTRRCSTVRHHKKRTSRKTSHRRKHSSKGKKHLKVEVKVHHRY
ncbi:hypothetical protein [Clostridium sp.]